MKHVKTVASTISTIEGCFSIEISSILPPYTQCLAFLFNIVNIHINEQFVINIYMFDPHLENRITATFISLFELIYAGRNVDRGRYSH
jgi:hypothetical protein